MQLKNIKMNLGQFTFSSVTCKLESQFQVKTSMSHPAAPFMNCSNVLIMLKITKATLKTRKKAVSEHWKTYICAGGGGVSA